MRVLVHDIRYALRGFVRHPSFTVVVLTTLALGIGANAAIFSVVSGILLRPLPYPGAERIVEFGHEPPTWLTSDANFLDYHRDLRTFDGLAAYSQNEVTLAGGEEPERLRSVRASADFFPVLGVKPLLGRTFVEDEYVPNPTSVVVLSHALWRRRFGGDASIVGRTISIGGIPRTVVGVMPPRFEYPQARTDLWSPLPRMKFDTAQAQRANNYLFMVGRIHAGVTIERARADARLIARRIMSAHPESFNPNQPLTPHIETIGDKLVGGTRPFLVALLAAVGFVLLIVCANVANLLLVRGEGRRKEMALRRALGASSVRLARQLLTESALLALAGGAMGLALAWAIDRALLAAAPSSVPRLADIGIDWRVLAFTLAASTVTGLTISLVPAWRVARGRPLDALKEGGKTSGAHGTARGARRALVVAEVALAVMMLSGAGMLLRSLWHLQGNDMGFDPRNVLTAKVSISAREYNDARAGLFFEQLVNRVRQMPGVIAAGAAGWLPVIDANGLWGIRPEGRSYGPGSGPDMPLAVPQQITPGYLTAVGLPLIAGRDISADDRDGAALVALVSAKLGKTVWPGESAIGQRFALGQSGSPYMTVVGIVGDIRSRGFDDVPEPTMYFPYAQAAKSAYFAPRAMSLVIKTPGDPRVLTASVRNAVRGLDRSAPVSEVRTLEEVVGTSVANRRFTTSLLAAFAALALVLAGVGTYGVIAYGVSQRTYEIGVRIALGAERSAVLSLVMSEGLRMAMAGLTIGLIGSVAVARGMRAMLVGLSLVDVPTLALVCVLLLSVAVVAALVPAQRTTKVSPTEALRGI
ncbi:MAG: ABC transporter permease [Gemmatimonadota bacterium]|nr:ABC transporter permease [Gemmatimonadota bacterium]